MTERVFRMPDLGEGLEEGEIVTWLVSAGDPVTLNQPLLEVETAKAAVEIPSPFAGTVVTLHGDAGDTVPVGRPLVTFAVDDGAAAPERTVRTTPPVRKLAQSLGVDLATVEGTGPQGRITAPDVERASGPGGGAEGALPPQTEKELRTEVVPLTPTRRAIAKHLSTQVTIPQVTTFRTVDCSALDAYRRELDVSPLPVVIAALCRTVVAHPMLNATWTDDAILMHGSVNVGLAVDTDRGLMVPVLQGADRRGIAGLAAEIARLGGSARAASLGLDDLTPTPTIAVSNTGSYGSEAGTPILSPGTAVTLAIGLIEPRALVVDGEIVARPACTLSCTFDHRLLDGAAAGRALTDLVTLLQDDERLRDLVR